MNLKLGSLFDGSGGFPLAGSICGIEPRWASEVEPYPIAVTRERFPNMKHLGDISKINGAEIEPVDIITFGSPCQDLSVAGKRAGLKHEANGDEETTRSGLFMEAVRIIKEMRRATNGQYPRFALWENVPGAFSSNKGEDFRIVCEELIKITEPAAFMPPVPKAGWAYADSYVGDGWSLAYRVFDAQYWGVPQRRRRIHLVVDFRGECAREVLFERDGVRGYFTQSGKAWQEAAANAEGSTGADDREGACLSFHLTQEPITSKKITPCISSGNPIRGQASVGVVTLEPSIAAREGGHIYEDVSGTLRANMGDNQMAVAYGVDDKTRKGFDATPVVYRQGGFGDYVEGEAGTLKASGGDLGGGSENLVTERRVHYIVRRLTPTECARLQGFADAWGHIEPKKILTDEEHRFWQEVRNTHAAINGKPTKEYTVKQMLTWYNKLYTDSAEYKMWGNGIALPPALYVMQGMADVLNGEKPLTAAETDSAMLQAYNVIAEHEDEKTTERECVTFEPGIAAREGGHIYEGVCETLRANAGDNRMAVAYVDSHILDDQGGSQITVRKDGKAPTLRAEMHGNVPCVLVAENIVEPTDLTDAPEEIKAEILENAEKLEERETVEEITEEETMEQKNIETQATANENTPADFCAVEQLRRLAEERKALANLRPEDPRFANDVRAIEYAVNILEAVGL